ncbi:hypothetical protein D3C86_1913370 [compost metagenome]
MGRGSYRPSGLMRLSEGLGRATGMVGLEGSAGIEGERKDEGENGNMVISSVFEAWRTMESQVSNLNLD